VISIKIYNSNSGEAFPPHSRVVSAEVHFEDMDNHCQEFHAGRIEFIRGDEGCSRFRINAHAFLRALNRAASVNFDVVTPVVPANSTSLNPTCSISPTRSRTGTAPPTQSDHAARLFATLPGRSAFRTISANWKRPPGLSTLYISLKLFSLSGERFSTPFEIITSNTASS